MLNSILNASLILILLFACLTDIIKHRIPNIITFGGLAIGLIIQAQLFGISGLFYGLGGMAVGLLLFLPMYMIGGMAAGDVKLMATAGAFMNPSLALLAACFSVIMGGILGIAVLILRGGALQALSRYALTLQCLLRTGQVSWIPPTPGEAATTRFPYALAIAVGTVTALWWTA